MSTFLSSFFRPAPEGYAERLADDLAARFDLDRASDETPMTP